MTYFALTVAAIYGLLGVALGAFGAHALSSRLGTDMQAIWHTGNDYQFYHALALLGVGVLMRTSGTSNWRNASAICFCAGVLIFSGSLYILALTGARGWGAVTPIGGVLLIAGWATLLIGIWRGM